MHLAQILLGVYFRFDPPPPHTHTFLYMPVLRVSCWSNYLLHFKLKHLPFWVFRYAPAAGTTLQLGVGTCVIDANTWTNTQFKCTVQSVPAGLHPIALTVGAIGLAQALSVVAYKSLLQVSTISPDQGSFAGGTLVTVKGAGFGNAPEQMSISLCGIPCLMVASSYSEATCITSKNRDGVEEIVRSIHHYRG